MFEMSVRPLFSFQKKKQFSAQLVHNKSIYFLLCRTFFVKLNNRKKKKFKARLYFAIILGDL
jgi:hypothetical protein